jgi:hypothetical protein
MFDLRSEVMKVKVLVLLLLSIILVIGITGCRRAPRERPERDQPPQQRAEATPTPRPPDFQEAEHGNQGGLTIGQGGITGSNIDTTGVRTTEPPTTGTVPQWTPQPGTQVVVQTPQPGQPGQPGDIVGNRMLFPLNTVHTWAFGGLGTVERGENPTLAQDLMANSTRYGLEYIVPEAEATIAWRADMDARYAARAEAEILHRERLVEAERRREEQRVNERANFTESWLLGDYHRLHSTETVNQWPGEAILYWDNSYTELNIVYLTRNNTYVPAFVGPYTEFDAQYVIAICKNAGVMLEVRGMQVHCPAHNVSYSVGGYHNLCMPLYQNTFLSNDVFNQIPGWHAQYIMPGVLRELNETMGWDE